VSRKLVGVVSVAFLAIPASRAAAYELQLAPSGEAVRWHRDPVLIEVAMDPAPDGVDVAAADAAVRRALATWSQAGAPEFVAAGSEQEPLLRVRFAMNAHDPAIDPAALALTHLNFDSLTGELVTVEIAVNGFAFRWATGDQCDRGADDFQYDFESTLAHEVGHAIGLRHSEDPEATMFTRPQPCARDRRDLAQDDLEAVAALYGDDGAMDDEAAPEPPAGCSVAGGQGGGASLVLTLWAVGAVVLVRRRPRAAADRCAG
jgi:hypothetical protein